MIRGKYLRERKAIRAKRRVKLLVTITIVLIVYRILCDSFSLFESQATSDTNMDIAFFLVDDQYFISDVQQDGSVGKEENTQSIKIADIEPGEKKEYTIKVSNFTYLDEEGKKTEPDDRYLKCADTNIKYTLIVRTTTNLPLKYNFFVGESPYLGQKVRNQVENGIIFYEYTVSNGNLPYEAKQTDTYKLSIEFPKDGAENADYQGMIEYIEVSIKAEQVVQN